MVPMVAKIVHCKPSLWDRSCCNSVVPWSLGDSLGQSNSVIECDGGTGVWSFLPSAGLPTGLPETFLEVHHSQRLFFPNVPSFPTLFSYVSDLYRPLTVFTWLLLLSLPFIFHKHYLPNFSCTSSSILFCFPEDLYWLRSWWIFQELGTEGHVKTIFPHVRTMCLFTTMSYNKALMRKKKYFM